MHGGSHVLRGRQQPQPVKQYCQLRLKQVMRLEIVSGVTDQRCRHEDAVLPRHCGRDPHEDHSPRQCTALARQQVCPDVLLGVVPVSQRFLTG